MMMSGRAFGQIAVMLHKGLLFGWCPQALKQRKARHFTICGTMYFSTMWCYMYSTDFRGRTFTDWWGSSWWLCYFLHCGTGNDGKCTLVSFMWSRQETGGDAEVNHCSCNECILLVLCQIFEGFPFCFLLEY